MACHAAVKANYPLTLEQMRYILEELRRTAYSSVCPHGRPVVLRITRREVEKNFQRIPASSVAAATLELILFLGEQDVETGE